MRKFIRSILCILMFFAAALAVTADTSIALTERAHIVPLPDGGTAYLDFYKSPSGGNGILFERTIKDPALLRAAPFYRITSAVIMRSNKNHTTFASTGCFSYPDFLGDDTLSFTWSQDPRSAKAVCMQFSRDGDIEVAVLSISRT